MRKALLSLVIVLTLIFSTYATAETITVYGTVVSVESITIVSNVKGIVGKINARVGDRIEKDAILAEIKTTEIIAPIGGQIQVWANASNSISELNEKYGAIAYIIPTETYSLKATPEDANGKRINASGSGELCCQRIG